MIKARACKGVGQEGSPGITFHSLGSEGEMNPHTSKWAPTFGVSMDSQILKEAFQGSKFIGLKRSLCHWKAFES
jgi:hypothetical protein